VINPTLTGSARARVFAQIADHMREHHYTPDRLRNGLDDVISNIQRTPAMSDEQRQQIAEQQPPAHDLTPEKAATIVAAHSHLERHGGPEVIGSIIEAGLRGGTLIPMPPTEREQAAWDSVNASDRFD
jgi:hypothetical protein